jgi:PAS domain S-box-containing protein
MLQNHIRQNHAALVCRYRPDTTLTFVNEAYCAFFDLPENHLVGRKFIELIPNHARQAALARVARLWRDRQTLIWEHQVVSAGSGTRWQQWVDSVVPSLDGTGFELEGYGRDIARSEQAEEAVDTASLFRSTDGFLAYLGWRASIPDTPRGGSLLQWLSARASTGSALEPTDDKLSLAGRLMTLGELSSSIIHELSQPLSAILNNADAASRVLASQHLPRHELASALDDIRGDCNKAAEVIYHLRTLLAGSHAEHYPVLMNDVVRDALHIVNAEARRQHVRIEMELQAIPSILGNGVLLKQVLLNLLLNAVHAMVETPRTKRRLVIASRATTSKTVQVTVSDAGHGLRGGTAPRLFSPFFSTKKDGLGLGLHIARRIVDAHGGRIWARNNHGGGGATFCIELPTDRGGS